MIHSISSYLTSNLVAFRNLNGKEENWPDSDKAKPTGKFYVKVISAEIGFALSAVVALVETYVYAFFMLPASLTLPFSYKPLTKLLFLTLSAANTLVWNIHNLYLNLFAYDLPTIEPFHINLNYIYSKTQFHREKALFLDEIQHFIAKRQNLINDENVQNINQFLKRYPGSFELLHTILERPTNLTLKNNLIDEASPTSFDLFAFVVVAEFISSPFIDSEKEFSKQSYLLPDSIIEQLKDCRQDQFFKQRIEKFVKKYWYYLNPAHFEKLSDSPRLSADERQLYLKIKSMSTPCIQGCLLFTNGLNAYFKFKDFLETHPVQRYNHLSVFH